MGTAAGDQHARQHHEPARLERGGELAYDELVIATGIGTDPSQIPGLAQGADQARTDHSSAASARLLRRTLGDSPGGTIARILPMTSGSPV